jgi:hypothetical protein
MTRLVMLATVLVVVVVWLAAAGVARAEQNQAGGAPIPGLEAGPPIPPPPVGLSPSIPVPLTPTGSPESRAKSGPPKLPVIIEGAPRGEAPHPLAVPSLPGRDSAAPVDGSRAPTRVE